jgi:hypothetical protein
MNDNGDENGSLKEIRLVCMCKGWAIKPVPAPQPSVSYCAKISM